MSMIERRSFLKLLAAAGITSIMDPALLNSETRHLSGQGGSYVPARIVNEYGEFLPGERDALAKPPMITKAGSIGVDLRTASNGRTLSVGEVIDGWRLLAVVEMNGAQTAIFEKHATHRGAIAFVTADRGTIALIPKGIGDLAKIRPRQISAPAEAQLRRPAHYVPGPDGPGEYILNSSEDPCYENVAALGPEFIGWTLVANEQGGPIRSLFLEPDGSSRELNNDSPQASWAPDEVSPVFDPKDLFPNDNVHVWKYEKGFSKRTFLGGFTPIADIGVWNQQYQCGYEAIVLLPEGLDVKPIARVRIMIPEDQITPEMYIYRDAQNRAFMDRYVNGNAHSFFLALACIWNHWNNFFQESMPVTIPDDWLLDSARAGIMLSRCSYRGLEPTYQVGEGAYTKIPERSHALFPVAQYEFIWAQQLWGLTSSSDEYFQYYLDKYVLPNGNFLYNVQDQAEAPLNVGFFLANSARGYFYRRDLQVFVKRLPVLRRMTDYVLRRYEYSKERFAPGDPHYGLIWGSPEADLGDPLNEYPDSHPFYYQNAVGVWRGMHDHALALMAAAAIDSTLASEATRFTEIATEMRTNIQRSLEITLAASSAEMKAAGITPFTPEDTQRDPKHLLSYENHRFMQDWFLADWGDQALDMGHLKHRSIAGMQLVGLHMDGVEQRTSNFMEHGTLAVKIRQEDYRSFLLTLYGLVCYAADSGNRYSPEDALIPGGYAGEGNKYWWSAVVNSVLQPTLGLRWLLCYEESDSDVCHLQKAAPKHWFKPGKRIAVERCPTRFGTVGWQTESLPGRQWRILVKLPANFACTLKIHIHPNDGRPITTTSLGQIEKGYVVLSKGDLSNQRTLEIKIG
jgi:hypothetical protein